MLRCLAKCVLTAKSNVAHSSMLPVFGMRRAQEKRQERRLFPGACILHLMFSKFKGDVHLWHCQNHFEKFASQNVVRPCDIGAAVLCLLWTACGNSEM